MKSNSIDTRPKSIENYLTQENKGYDIFNVPSYQRQYAWTKDECDRLWDDIENFTSNNAAESYYFGSIIINCDDKKRKYDLIDGQQRTTSFILLLKAFLTKINEYIVEISENKESDKKIQRTYNGLVSRRKQLIHILYSVSDRDILDLPIEKEDKKIYKKFKKLINNSNMEADADDLINILRASSIDEIEKVKKEIKHKKGENRFTNYYKNFKNFYEKVSNLKDGSLIDVRCEKVLMHCEVIEIKSWSEDQAITMFNSLNSAGQPLNDAQIIQSLLSQKAEKNVVSLMLYGEI